MKKISLSFLPVMLLFIVSSCKKEVSSPAKSDEQNVQNFSAQNKSVNSGLSDLLKSVRGATARFNSTQQAIAADYVPDDHCVSHPTLGGMGYHWANPSLIDPVLNYQQPEVLLYARGPGGNLRLVAVEYIVLNMGQPRPAFGDRLFDIGGTPVPLPHWSLHVWLYEENPNGMFTPFNPNISCQ